MRRKQIMGVTLTFLASFIMACLGNIGSMHASTFWGTPLKVFGVTTAFFLFLGGLCYLAGAE